MAGVLWEIVDGPLGHPGHHWQHRLGAIQSLDLGLSSTHGAGARSGGSRYRPSTSCILSTKNGPVDSLNVSEQTVSRDTPTWSAITCGGDWETVLADSFTRQDQPGPQRQVLGTLAPPYPPLKLGIPIGTRSRTDVVSLE